MRKPIFTGGIELRAGGRVPPLSSHDAAILARACPGMCARSRRSSYLGKKFSSTQTSPGESDIVAMLWKAMRCPSGWALM